MNIIKSKSSIELIKLPIIKLYEQFLVTPKAAGFQLHQWRSVFHNLNESGGCLMLIYDSDDENETVSRKGE